MVNQIMCRKESMREEKQQEKEWIVQKENQDSYDKFQSKQFDKQKNVIIKIKIVKLSKKISV